MLPTRSTVALRLAAALVLSAAASAAFPFTIVIGSIRSISYADETNKAVRVNLFETSSPCGPGSSPFAYLGARADFRLHVDALASAKEAGRPVTLLVEHIGECCQILEWSVNPWHQVGLPGSSAPDLKSAAARSKTGDERGMRHELAEEPEGRHTPG